MEEISGGEHALLEIMDKHLSVTEKLIAEAIHHRGPQKQLKELQTSVSQLRQQVQRMLDRV